jgi:predicted esterase
MPHTPKRPPVRAALAVLAALSLLAACSDDPPVSRGELVGDRSVATLPKATIDAATAASGAQVLTGTARCAVDVRQLVHTTVQPDGTQGSASAALLVPVADGGTCTGPFPILAYNRGTEVLRARTMANPNDPETGLLMGFYAAQGFVVVATDYLGYAESRLPYHPYLHAESQASTTIDSIIAARRVLAARGVAVSSKLFLSGYSQGGHASMATHRTIQADESLGLTVTAGGHMSGPYDLAGSFVTGVALLPSGTGGSTVFTPMVLTSFQRVYGNIYAAPADFYKAPYVNGIETLLPGATPFNDLFTTGKLPLQLGDLLTPAAVAAVTNTSSGLRQALDRNTLLSWRPLSPVLLCGGSRDPVVLFQNTTRSAQAIAAAGGSATVVDVEQVPAFAAALPPANATAAQLATYHGGVVPPLCMKVVRDNLFAALR